MSYTKEKRKVEVSDLQRSWTNVTLPAMNLTPKVPRHLNSLVRQPLPVQRQPTLVDNQ